MDLLNSPAYLPVVCQNYARQEGVSTRGRAKTLPTCQTRTLFRDPPHRRRERRPRLFPAERRLRDQAVPERAKESSAPPSARS
ncbi:hypothetical protein VTH06DRAFT_4217, partial [Thermothelomyces fergusii]